MKTKIILLFLASLAARYSCAQTLSPVVVSTSGAFYSNGSAMLSTTIGELTMVETFSNGSVILNQGFQQAFDFTTGINNPLVSSGLNIFPNPTSGSVSVRVPSSFIGKADVSVYDAIGKLVFKKSGEFTGSSTTFVLSLGNLIDGMYLLEVRTSSEEYVTKINLIK